MREHNRIAERLYEMNPKADGEVIYHGTFLFSFQNLTKNHRNPKNHRRYDAAHHLYSMAAENHGKGSNKNLVCQN